MPNSSGRIQVIAVLRSRPPTAMPAEATLNNYRVVSVHPQNVIPRLVPGTFRRTVLELVPGTSPINAKIDRQAARHVLPQRHPRARPGDLYWHIAAFGPRDEPGDNVGGERAGAILTRMGTSPGITLGENAPTLF
jgi:hypothetical protein